MSAPAFRLSILAAIAVAASNAALADDVRIVQTNSRDSVVHLIDPDTQTIVGEIGDIPIPHGVAVAPDGGRLYVSSEAKQTLDVIDGRTFERVKEIPLSDRPNNISIGRDGRFVYVGIMDGEGGIDVIDTTTLTNAAPRAESCAAASAIVCPVLAISSTSTTLRPV